MVEIVVKPKKVVDCGLMPLKRLVGVGAAKGRRWVSWNGAGDKEGIRRRVRLVSNCTDDDPH